MGNTLLTPNIIAREALMALENELVMGNLVHRAYSQEYQKVGSTVAIRKPATFEASAFTAASTVAVQDATESSVNVVLDRHMDVSFEVTSTELSLDVVSFSEQFIQPAMRAQAQEMDKRLCYQYFDVACWGTVTGTPAVGDVAKLRSYQSILKAPLSDRRMVVSPQTEASYLALDAFLHAEKRGDTKAIRDAHMGRVLGYDWYMDQNIYSHTEGGAWDSGTNLLKGAGASAATSCTIDAVNSAGTVNAYDVFKVQGYDQWHVVAAAATATVATVVVTFQPAFADSRVDNATVIVPGTHKANLAFHKNAIALVTAPLAPPIGGAQAGILSYKGLTCRVVYDYDITYKNNQISIDTLYGAKVLDRDLAARFTDAN